MNVDPKRARKLVRNFERAVRLHEMAGAAHPEDRPLIQEDYENAKERLISTIKQMSKS